MGRDIAMGGGRHYGGGHRYGVQQGPWEGGCPWGGVDIAMGAMGALWGV